MAKHGVMNLDTASGASISLCKPSNVSNQVVLFDPMFLRQPCTFLRGWQQIGSSAALNKVQKKLDKKRGTAQRAIEREIIGVTLRDGKTAVWIRELTVELTF